MGKKTALTSYGFLFIALLSGTYIYQSTVYENGYQTSDEGEKRQVAYEKQLKQYEFMAQPKIIKVNLKADLYPLERDAYFEAEVSMVNKTDEPIDSVHFNSASLTDFEILYNGQELPYRFPLHYEPRKFQIFGKKAEKEWYRITALPQTLMPGTPWTW
ncbi:hypothetical protein V8V91_12735 [Algoriphagus halophilus]|uniref:hypothetical protein n=1 Tax=Algoriphagus halophilus TaxID=226505 RepID=UPI00358F45E0